MSGKYDDMLSMERPRPQNRRPMPPQERAAQFSPFAALSGYEQVIEEAGRLTEGQIELDEDALQEIERALHRLAARLEEGREPVQIVLSWFEADEKKAGGRYRTEPVTVRRVDPVFQRLELADHSGIGFGQIYGIKEPD